MKTLEPVGSFYVQDFVNFEGNIGKIVYQNSLYSALEFTNKRMALVRNDVEVEYIGTNDVDDT